MQIMEMIRNHFSLFTNCRDPFAPVLPATRHFTPLSDNLLELLNDLPLIQQAAEKAGVHKAIHDLPLGYQTMLSGMFGEETSRAEFSGGEWQKVASARLFMRQADLLILVEPTAALDPQAEYEIYNRFTELVKGRTCLLISHRLSTVRMADVIAVLENGNISEYGVHEELLARGGAYATLYHMQANRYQTAN